MTEFEELDKYLYWLTTHGRKPLTVRDYRYSLIRTLTRLKEAGRPYLMAEIREEDIFWLDEQMSETACETVRRQYLRRLGNMCVHFTGRDIVKDAAIMYNEALSGAHTYFITKEQFAELYRSADEMTKLILVLGAYLGLRRAEMASIKESDIKGSVVIIHGKGHGPNGKVRQVDMPQTVIDEIARYRAFKDTQPHGHTGEFLIEGCKGTGVRHGVTPDTIGRKLNQLKRDTGIEFSTHSLRRLYATTAYYETDAKLVTIKNMLGHAKAETTYNRYIAPMRRLEQEAQEEVADSLNRALGIV